MAQSTVITITHGGEAAQTIKDMFGKNTTNPLDQAGTVEQFFMSVAGGQRNCKFDIQVNGGSAVAASGTITFTGAGAANDTILINGVTFTAVASGATGNQWNVGGSLSISATNLAAAINASATALVSGIVSASSLAGVVTIAALVKGTAGNAVTIAKGVDAGTVMTVSGARLTAGANASANVYRCGV